jgi:hypothetical protein
MRVASSSDLLEDVDMLDSVFATEAWQLLMTFTRESARAYRCHAPGLLPKLMTISGQLPAHLRPFLTHLLRQEAQTFRQNYLMKLPHRKMRERRAQAPRV